MKSKTSCFNRTIFKKNFTHYWPLWVLWLCYLTLVLPFSLWLSVKQDAFIYYGDLSPQERGYEIMHKVIEAGIQPIPIFIAAAVAALAVFYYLYAPRNANMMHSFPVSRLELFTTNYLSGLLFIVIPEVVTFLSAVLVCMANQLTCIQYLFEWLLYVIGMTFFAYSLAVFVAMFMGQGFAMLACFFILNVLYEGCVYIMNRVILSVSYGVVEGWHPGKSRVLSPFIYLCDNIYVFEENEGGHITGLSISGGTLVAVYAATAVLLVAAAYRVYRKRQIETAGDVISIGIIKPIFRWGFAWCSGITLALALTAILTDALNANVFFSLMGGMLVFGFICFFVAEMILRKEFKVFRKKRLKEWGIFAVLSLLFIVLFEVDAFGIVRYIPDKEEIKTVFVDMDYPVEVSEEQWDTVMDIHRAAVENKKFYLKNSKNETGHYYTTIVYHLKDGSAVRRRYDLPLGDNLPDGMADSSETIQNWERETENLKRQILGRNYEQNTYYGGLFSRFNSEGKQNDYRLNADETEQLIAAVEKDIEAGNFDGYCINSIPGEFKSYQNALYLDYTNPNRVNSNWEYYNGGYRSVTETEIVVDTEVAESERGYQEVYLPLGDKCVNTIKMLEELGILDEEWKVMTYSEYNQLMGW